MLWINTICQLLLCLHPQGPHIMKNITQKANITGGKQLERAHTNTELDPRQVTTSSCTVIAQQRLLVHLCTKRVINTKTHRINCSLWLYCGSYLSLMQSILIRDVNYPCDSRQLICFVFFPLHPPATPAYQFPRRSILSLFLPKGLINCREWVYRAGIFVSCWFSFSLSLAQSQSCFQSAPIQNGTPCKYWHSHPGQRQMNAVPVTEASVTPKWAWRSIWSRRLWCWKKYISIKQLLWAGVFSLNTQSDPSSNPNILIIYDYFNYFSSSPC